MGYSKEQVHQLLQGAKRPSRPAKRKRPTPVGRRGDDSVLPEEILALFHKCPTTMLDDGWPEELLYAFEIGYDTGVGRITFPIRNQYNQLMAISGRTPYPIVIPKYKIYREEDLYEMAPEDYTPKRAQLIYNIQRAYMINAREPVVICEGFKEVMRLHQAGIVGVGLLGVQFTRQQVDILRRLHYRTRCQFIIALDNDEPGQRAVDKLGRRLLRFTHPKVVTTTEVKDISDVSDLREVSRLVRTPQTFLEWRKQHEYRRNEKTQRAPWQKA
jgi:DNA primase